MYSVGYAAIFSFFTIAALPAFSPSTSSQTNCPACRASEASVKTNAFIERHVCHQGADASMKIGTLRVRASASALG